MAQALETWQPQSAGERIMLVRKRLKWSQAELARRLRDYGLRGGESMVSRWESGRREDRPSLPQLVVLAGVLGVSPADLGATPEEYPVIAIFVEAGWNPARVVKQIRCTGKRVPHLWVVRALSD